MNKFIIAIIVNFLLFSSVSLAQDQISTSAQAFGKLPEIRSVSISPDGTKILMMQNYQGRKILVTRSLTDLNEPQNGIPPLANQEYMWARWASNDRIIAGLRFAYMNKLDTYGGLYVFGTTETRLVSMNWKGEDPVNPIRLNPKRTRQSQIQDRVVNILKDDPDHILVQLDYHEEFEPGVYKVDITRSRTPRQVVKGRGYIDSWRTDGNNVVRYGVGTSDRYGSMKMRYVSYYRATEDSIWNTLFDFDLIKQNAPFNFSGFSKDPNVIYVTAIDDTGRRSAFTYDVRKKDFIEKIISIDGYDISNVYVNEEGEVELYTYFDVQPRLVYLDEKKQNLLDLLHRTFPNKSINFNSRTEDENTVVFEVTSPTEPGTFYIFDQENKKMEMLGYNYQEVDIETLSQMEPITYQARDGLEIPGYLSLPAQSDGKKLPTVILPHGGPFARDNWSFDYWTQFLTSQGYAVLQMNYRGSTGYGDEYRDMGKHEWGGKMIDDINDGAKWMIEQGYTDPDRMCIVGASYGGYAALQTIVKDQSLYKCSVAFAPVANLKNRVEYYEEFGDTNSYVDYMVSDSYTLEEASPSFNIDKLNVPILLFHGIEDRSVRVSQSQFFYGRMNRAGKDIKYIEWEDGDHFLSKEKHRVEFLEEIGKFLKQHL